MAVVSVQNGVHLWPKSHLIQDEVGNDVSSGPSLLGTMILFFLRDLTKRFLGVDVAVRTETMRSNESIKSTAPRLNDSQQACQATPLAKIAFGLVCLDYSAGVVQHADRCPVRARERAILRVRDGGADRVWPGIPDRSVSKPIAD